MSSRPTMDKATGLLGSEINELCAEYKPPYLQVTDKYGLPNYPVTKDSVIVANTSAVNQPGAHWVSFALYPHSSTVVYFNSLSSSDKFNKTMFDYNKRATLNNMRRRMKKGALRVVSNKKNVQPFLSNACGLYCSDFVRMTKQYKQHVYKCKQFAEYKPNNNPMNDAILRRHMHVNKYYQDHRDVINNKVFIE